VLFLQMMTAILWVQTNPLYAAVFSFAFLLLAACSAIKDTIFADAKKKTGQDLDLVRLSNNPASLQSLLSRTSPHGQGAWAGIVSRLRAKV